MKTVVAITGAGWDPVEEVRTRKKGYPIPERTPEMFWQLAPDHTVLSRQMAQWYKKMGVDKVFVGMGNPGCDPTVVEYHDAEVYGVGVSDYGKSPWTDEQVTYVIEQGGFPLLMPDPHAKGQSCWTTLLKMAPAILAEDCDRIVITAGDYVFRTGFLQYLLDWTAWPSQFWFWTKHSIEFLTRGAFMKFLSFLRSLPNQDQSLVWARRGTCAPSKVWGERKDVFDWMMEDWIEVSHHSWKNILALAEEDPV